MNDYELLKKAHNNLPEKYKLVMIPYLKSYAAYIVSGGKELDERAKTLFRQYLVGYKIYHFQQKEIDFDFWELMEQPYDIQRELALKIASNNGKENKSSS